MVFVTSDNGPWHLGNPGRLRGRKGQTMEGGQRVAAIAHWPGHIPAGSVIDGVRSAHWKYNRWGNLYTFPVPLDKVNSFIDRGAHQATYKDPQTGGTVQLITHDPLFFAVEDDTNESYNVIARHPEQAVRLRAAIEAWEREFFANPRGWK